MTIMNQTYVLSYEWGDGEEEEDNGFHFSSDEPFSVPDVGEHIYLDPNDGQGPRRTLFIVGSRVFEVQRGNGFSIHSTYVNLRRADA